MKRFLGQTEIGMRQHRYGVDGGKKADCFKGGNPFRRMVEPILSRKDAIKGLFSIGNVAFFNQLRGDHCPVYVSLMSFPDFLVAERIPGFPERCHQFPVAFLFSLVDDAEEILQFPVGFLPQKQADNMNFLIVVACGNLHAGNSFQPGSLCRFQKLRQSGHGVMIRERYCPQLPPQSFRNQLRR